MKEQGFTMYCEKQPPSIGQPDIIIRRQPTPPDTPRHPDKPVEPIKKMVDQPKEQPKR
jgi:hypothetical protein